MAPNVLADFTDLVRRVAASDRSALRLLYIALCGAVREEAGQRLARYSDVRAVVNATFLEVWWLARFHCRPGDDVLAWVIDIACRRAAERVRTPRRGSHDERTRLDLARLIS